MAVAFVCDCCGKIDRWWEANKAHLRMRGEAAGFEGVQLDLDLCGTCTNLLWNAIQEKRDQASPGWREREAERKRTQLAQELADRELSK